MRGYSIYNSIIKAVSKTFGQNLVSNRWDIPDMDKCCAEHDLEACGEEKDTLNDEKGKENAGAELGKAQLSLS